jgi:hypothetical protein
MGSKIGGNGKGGKMGLRRRRKPKGGKMGLKRGGKGKGKGG